MAHMTRLEHLSLARTSLRMLAPDVLWPFYLLNEFDASETILGVVWIHLERSPTRATSSLFASKTRAFKRSPHLTLAICLRCEIWTSKTTRSMRLPLAPSQAC